MSLYFNILDSKIYKLDDSDPKSFDDTSYKFILDKSWVNKYNSFNVMIITNIETSDKMYLYCANDLEFKGYCYLNGKIDDNQFNYLDDGSILYENKFCRYLLIKNLKISN